MRDQQSEPVEPTTTRGHVDPRVKRTATAILDAAAALLIKQGPDAVTHAQVAQRANVSRTTVYSHHPTREDLLRTTFERMQPPTSMTLQGDLRADLLTGLTTIATDMGADHRMRMFAAILERSQHDPEVAAVRLAIVRATMAHFTSALEHGINTGQIRKDLDIDLATASLVGTYYFRRFLSDQPVTTQIVEKIVDTFLHLNTPAEPHIPNRTKPAR